MSNFLKTVYKNVRFLSIFVTIKIFFMSEKNLTEKEFHKKLAVDCFNKTWKKMELKDPTNDDIAEAIRLAHASTFHWSFVGAEINQQRGEWICSRVYAHFGFPESALYHAKRCYDLTMKYRFDDFDLGYAYEAMARAYMVLKNEEEKEKFLTLAKESIEQIKKKEDREWFLKDLSSIK